MQLLNQILSEKTNWETLLGWKSARCYQRHKHKRFDIWETVGGGGVAVIITPLPAKKTTPDKFSKIHTKTDFTAVAETEHHCEKKHKCFFLTLKHEHYKNKTEVG